MLTLKDTIVPKSDQLNAEQLLSGPITVTVTGVRLVAADQPVIIDYENQDGRPYKPCKSMRKLLIFAWGDNGDNWVGRSMTLYNKADVKFGGVEVGGIRISHLSHIDKDISVALTATRGRKETHIVKRMQMQTVDHTATLKQAASLGMQALVEAWSKLPASVRKSMGNTCPQEYKDIAANVGKTEPEPQLAQDIAQDVAPDDDAIF